MTPLLVSVDMASAVHATTSIAAIGIIVMSLEDVVGLSCFRDNGILSWRVLKLQDRWSLKGITAKLAEFFFSYSQFRFLIVARLVASVVLLLFQKHQPVFLLGCFVIFVSLVGLSFRSIYGLDGAHQMYVIIFGALFCGGLTGDRLMAKTCSIWFVALQAGLAYLVSGVSKCISDIWRNGTALVGVLGTDIYGHRQAYTLLSEHPAIARLLSWTVILFECGFCLVFLVNFRIGVWIIAGGVCFHLVNAVLMGLNDFLFAFVATYPCIAYCALHAPQFGFHRLAVPF